MEILHRLQHRSFSYSILDKSDSCNSSSTNLRQQESSKHNTDERQNVVHISLSLKDESSSTRRRRSRFEEDLTKSTVEKPLTTDELIPPVIARKLI